MATVSGMCMVLSLLCSLSFFFFVTKYDTNWRNKKEETKKSSKAGSPFSLSLPFFFLCSSNFPLNSYCDKKQKKEDLRRRLYMVLYGYKYIGRVASTPAP